MFYVGSRPGLKASISGTSELPALAADLSAVYDRAAPQGSYMSMSSKARACKDAVAAEFDAAKVLDLLAEHA